MFGDAICTYLADQLLRGYYPKKLYYLAYKKLYFLFGILILDRFGKSEFCAKQNRTRRVHCNKERKKKRFPTFFFIKKIIEFFNTKCESESCDPAVKKR